MFNYYLGIFVQCKTEILTGVFSALAIHSYFYGVKSNQKNEIMAVKKKLNEPIKDSTIMSDERFKHLEDVLHRIEAYVKERLDKIDIRMKDNEDDNEVLKVRIMNIEKNNAITRREIAIYITIAVFVVLQILEKINVI